MLNTLEKVKSLEQYLTISNTLVDPVIDHTINKLLTREYQRISEMQNRLLTDVNQFETHYAMPSTHFQTQYDNRLLGDDMDFIEWSATLDMLSQIEKQLKWLNIAVEQ